MFIQVVTSSTTYYFPTVDAGDMSAVGVELNAVSVNVDPANLGRPPADTGTDTKMDMHVASSILSQPCTEQMKNPVDTDTAAESSQNTSTITQTCGMERTIKDGEELSHVVRAPTNPNVPTQSMSACSTLAAAPAPPGGTGLHVDPTDKIGDPTTDDPLVYTQISSSAATLSVALSATSPDAPSGTSVQSAKDVCGTVDGGDVDACPAQGSADDVRPSVALDDHVFDTSNRFKIQTTADATASDMDVEHIFPIDTNGGATSVLSIEAVAVLHTGAHSTATPASGDPSGGTRSCLGGSDPTSPGSDTLSPTLSLPRISVELADIDVERETADEAALASVVEEVRSASAPRAGAGGVGSIAVGVGGVTIDMGNDTDMDTSPTTAFRFNKATKQWEAGVGTTVPMPHVRDASLEAQLDGCTGESNTQGPAASEHDHDVGACSTAFTKPFVRVATTCIAMHVGDGHSERGYFWL